MKKVIDGDRMICLEEFDKADTDTIVKKYQDMGIYGDIGVDIDGDIVLYEEE